jgi:hypothetical protein
MIGMIEKSLKNLFTGTMDEPVLGEVEMTEGILRVEKSPKRKDKGPKNKYLKVKNLPANTELTLTVLEPICFDNALTDRNFVDGELTKFDANAFASQGSGFNLQLMQGANQS